MCHCRENNKGDDGKYEKASILHMDHRADAGHVTCSISKE